MLDKIHYQQDRGKSRLCYTCIQHVLSDFDHDRLEINLCMIVTFCMYLSSADFLKIFFQKSIFYKANDVDPNRPVQMEHSNLGTLMIECELKLNCC